MEFTIHYENLAEFLDAWNHRTHIMTDEDIKRRWRSLHIARTFINGVLLEEYRPVILRKERKTKLSEEIKEKLKNFNFILKKNI